MASQEREIALRAHIRTLLLDYALSHLTENYVDHTEAFVSQVLVPTLGVLPTSDPTLPILEPSLYDQLNSSLKIGRLPAYNEKWSTDSQSLSLIKYNFAATRQSQDVPSSACWREDTFSPMERISSLVLSRKARKETPKLGSNSVSAHTFSSLADLIDKHRLPQIQDEAIEEKTNLLMNDVLGHRIALDAGIHTELHNLLKSTLNLAPNRGTSSSSAHNSHCENFVRSISPPIDLPESLTPPVFAQESMFGTGVAALDIRDRGVRKFERIKSMILPQALPQKDIVDDDPSSEDCYMRDMSIANGWHTFPAPSSPTPSLEEEVDELDPKWLISSSSPIQQPVFEMMDEYELPRTEKFRGMDKKVDLPGSGERLDMFLSFLRPIPCAPGSTGGPDVKVVTPPKSQITSPSTSIAASLSMIGQAPSMLTELETNEIYPDFVSAELAAPSSDDSLGLQAVVEILDRGGENAPKHNFDASAFIIRERLDEKETMLMDVPELAPPNQHTSTGPVIPTTLSALRADSEDGRAEARSSLIGFLRKIKGFQSLNMELSWRPFHFGSSVPTHEEVTRLAEGIRQDCLADMSNEGTVSIPIVEDTLSHLLAEVDLDETVNVKDTASKKWQDEDTSGFPMPHDESTTLVVLTAAERRRLYKLPEPVYGRAGSDNEESLAEDPKLVGISRKRMRNHLSAADREDLGFCQDLAAMKDPESLAGYLENADDSRVYLLGFPTYDDTESRTSYLELADSACGFDGPDDNLDELFADVDPIHFEDAHVSDFGAAYDAGVSIDPTLLSAKCPPMESASTSMGDFSRSPRVQEVTRDSVHRIPSTLQLREESTLAFNPEADYMQPPIDLVESDSRLLDAVSAKHSLQEFMKLRAKSIAVLVDPAVVSTHSSSYINIAGPSSGPVAFQIPMELVDHTTVQAPEQAVHRDNWHRYLGSLEVIQRIALTRALSAPDCKVQLVERESLNGADIVIDPHTAVIVFLLRNLPTQCDSLNARINQLSWRFSRILVVFEAVPSCDINASKNSLAINPFSPAVVKAVKKVRRDMEIADACLDKQEGTRVQFSFPMSVDAAALIIRRYGDMSYAEDTSNGLLWDDRHWLDSDYEDPDERDLAVFDGMNVFAAAVILSRDNLDNFIDKPPEQRAAEFGELIGHDRIVSVMSKACILYR
ncbi:hypothetical protein BDY19DRAFT_22568 [Irpex rosettiformis]|uniref:Uncharacterized protein n=1 Tax=Irpex rosettiformis TaxID=378272 RepID=A0ACB8UJB3_9APHY|nr:hypothetical protein BDY19DRAFT_22568 [Irpex rosettiformis]